MSVECESKADTFERNVTITREKVRDCIAIGNINIVKNAVLIQLHLIDSRAQKNTNSYM